MPRYKHVDYSQSRLIPIDFAKQLIPGTLEFTINEVIDKHIDLSVFDKNYHNDETGATAYSPAVMLKIVLLAYSRGIISCRKIEIACQENITFKAISNDTEPDFTTIASFIRNMGSKVEDIFADVLLLCHTIRSKLKVNIQWMLYCLVHNIEKLKHCMASYKYLFQKDFGFLF